MLISQTRCLDKTRNEVEVLDNGRPTISVAIARVLIGAGVTTDQIRRTVLISPIIDVAQKEDVLRTTDMVFENVVS